MKATYERQLAVYQKSHATVFENHRKKSQACGQSVLPDRLILSGQK